MFRVLCAALLAASFSCVVKADDLPDDTQVRAMTIHPDNSMVIPSTVATLKECRESIAEMIDQLKTEDAAGFDGTVYACIPVDLDSNELTLLKATRFKRNMFKQ